MKLPFAVKWWPMVKLSSFLKSKILSDTLTILLIGVIIRVIIAPFTLNWDLLANTHISVLALTNTWAQIYDNPLSVYPPLMYMTLSTFIKLTTPFFPAGFFSWMASDNLTAISFPFIFRTLFLLKLPYIFFEVSAAFLFAKIFEKGKQNTVFFLWMINPVSLFVVTAWTNVDAFPLFFIVSSFYLASRGKNLSSALSLGIAAAYKLYPLLFFPFLLFSERTWRRRILMITLFILPVIITHYPVISLSQYYNHAITGGYSKQILFSILPIGANRALIYYCLAYFLLFLHFLTVKKDAASFITFSFFAIAAMFILSLFSLQWFIWLLPFLLFFQVRIPKLFPVILLSYLGYFGIVILSQASLNIGMLNPLEPTFWTLGWPLREILGTEQLFTQTNIMHSLIAASLIWIGFQTHKQIVQSQT